MVNTVVVKYTTLWNEIRVPGTHPERRSYHTAVAWNGNIYVYGGQDLREGVFSGLWVLHIDYEDSRNDYWEKLEGDANAPGELCRHSAVVYGDSMWLFGGTDNSDESSTVYCFDFNSRSWTKYPPTAPGCPPAMDSHTAVLHNDLMIVFGGFIDGSRTNQVFVFNLTTKTWAQQPCEGTLPPARSGHSATVYKDGMYILGG
jgi:N-acetylneuraminic acid mutarotase